MSAVRQLRRRGFTLIELMVSIALFGLIASGAMMLVMSGLRMQSHSARVDVAQSALRAGLDFMTRDLLSASAGMTSGTLRINGTDNNTIAFVGASNTGVNGSDVLDLYMADSNYDFATLYTAASTASTTLGVDKVSPFTAGQYAILTDLASGVRVNITSTSAPSGGPPPVGTLAITGLGTGSFPTGITTYGATNSFVFVLRHVRYSIGQCFPAGNTTLTYANQLCLMMDVFDGPANVNNGSNPQPLAEGVEDLQVAFGYDNNADGAINESTPGDTNDEWYGNASGDTIPPTLANLKAVRITIIATSTLNENANTLGATQQRPAAEDHAAGSADGFFRRIIRTEISVRNFNI